jgi:preprotein translocase subunit SecE
VSTEALAGPERRNLGVRFVHFLRDVRTEMRKVTWPTAEELKKATVVIIGFVAFLGVMIGLMDTVLQFALVTAVAKWF